MSNEKMGALAKKLLEKTQSGSLEWKEDPFEDGFVTKIAKTNVFLKINDGKRVLQLKNNNGTIVEEVSHTDSDITYEVSSNIIDLYDTAKRSALGTDKLIDDIITELDDEIPF